MLRTCTRGLHRSGRAVWIASAALLGAPCLLMGQQAAAPPAPSPGGRDMPTPDQLEPGVSTTATAPAAPAGQAAPATPATQAAPAATGAPAAPASSAASAAGDPKGVTPAAPAAGAGGKGAASAASGKAAPRKGPDRLELDATDITGNRELPKVLYIVPWKRSDLGDVVGRPVNSLLDEVLQPLDRDVFQRENRYYDGLKTGAGDAKAGAASGSPNKP